MKLQWSDISQSSLKRITDRTEYMVKFLDHDNIDSSKFLSNFQFLYGHSIFNMSPICLTSSIYNFEFSPTRPLLPDWFIAAYPDSIAWAIKQSDEDLKSNIYFDITPKQSGEVMHDSSEVQSKVFRRIVEYYKIQTGNALECT